MLARWRPSVSDDIYDYFSGNATRKVEPIEDDDDDVTQQEPAQVEAEAEADSVADSPELASATPEIAEADAPEPAEPEATGGHWDFLAGFLGIGGSKGSARQKSASAKASAKPVTASKPKESKPAPAKKTPEPVSKQADVKSEPPVEDKVPAQVESSSPAGTEEDDLFAAFAGFGSPAKSEPRQKKKDEPAPPRSKRNTDGDRKRNSEPKSESKREPASGGGDFFGLDDVPSPEDSTPLKTMFGGSPSTDTSLTDDSKGGDADAEGAEFIEIEIRDLVDADDDQDQGPRRRRRRGRGRGRNAQREEVISDDTLDAPQGKQVDREADRSEGGSRSRRSRGRGRGRGRDRQNEAEAPAAVSYTHLTLPTICSV